MGAPLEAGGDLGLQGVIVGEQGGVAVAGVEAVGVFDVQVVGAGFDLRNAHAPAALGLRPVAPSGFFEVKLFDADGAGLGTFFIPVGQRVNEELLPSLEPYGV